MSLKLTNGNAGFQHRLRFRRRFACLWRSCSSPTLAESNRIHTFADRNLAIVVIDSVEGDFSMRRDRVCGWRGEYSLRKPRNRFLVRIKSSNRLESLKTYMELRVRVVQVNTSSVKTPLATHHWLGSLEIGQEIRTFV